jgi:hypothetical protein
MKTNIKSSAKRALALCVCLTAGFSTPAFTLYNGQQNLSVNNNGGYPPQADFDSAPALYEDLSDCINRAHDHWAWPAAGGKVVITYYFDSSFDSLFAGRNGPAVETQVKAQIVLAMQQWAAIGNGTLNSAGYDSIYGPYDSYARANPLSLNIQNAQTVSPFMDVRSATVHELGHVLGFAHCDDGVKAGLNFAYFDELPVGNRGVGPNFGIGGTGGLGQYNGIPGNGTPGNVEVFNNYFLQISGNGIPGYGPPGMYGQEVMSQYSSDSLPPLGNGIPQFGRQPGEIYHTLSWDELDGYLFIYGTLSVEFEPAASEGGANLVIQAGKNNPLTGQPFEPGTICEGVPYGVPNNPSDSTQGVTIQNATITFNSQSAVPIGFETAGFNLDITTDNTVPNVNGVEITVSGTDNTTLAGPTFNNRVYASQPNPNYVFNSVDELPMGPEPVDSIGVSWSNPNQDIPEGTLLHVGLTPDVWDWVDYPVTTVVFGDGGYAQNVPATPVHIWSSASFHGFAVNPSPLDNRISASCLTSISSTNTAGVVGLAMIAPTNSSGNPTRVYNLQLADVTGMGLALSNLNSQTLALLEQSNMVITVTNFGTNILSSGQQFVAIMEGSASYLPPQIATNSDYIYLNRPDLADRELFAVVTSSDGHTTVHNYTLINAPPTVAGAFALGASSLLIGPAAGSNSIVLAAPSPVSSWTAAANAPWLHLSAANQSGDGSTNVVFSYDANVGSTRVGTLTIAGQTVTITQAGSTYVRAAGPVTTLVGSGLNQPWDAEPDGAGNVYIADLGDNQIKKWTAANNTVSTLVSSNLNAPQGVAVDGAGNVYIADGHNNAVKEWLAANNSVITLFSNVVNNPYSVTLDGAGNLYVADFGNDAVKEWTATNGNVTTLVASTNLSGPTSVSLDIAGNLYISDYFDDQVKELTLANSNLATLFSPLSGQGPNGVAVDGGGNIVVADEGNYHVEEWSAASRNLTTLVSSGLNTPQKVAVDASGNIYIADRFNNAVKELPYAFVDPTSKLEGAAAGTDTLPVVLPAAENLSGPFAPTNSQPWLTINGVTNGVVNFGFTTNNTGSNRVATITVLGQPVTITQSAMVAPVVAWSPLSPITYGTLLSSNQLDATANVSGTFTYYPPAGTMLAAGSYTLTAVLTPAKTNYLTVTNTESLTVMPATPLVTWTVPAPITYGAALSSNQLDATADVPGTFIYVPPIESILQPGSNSLLVFFTPSDTNDYTSATASVSLLVNTSSIPILLTSLNALAVPAGNPAGKFSAVDATGFFGPAGSNIFLSAAQIGLQNGGPSATANAGFIDPVRGTFGLNWAPAAAFAVYDATGSNRVGSAQLLMAFPEVGAYNPTNGFGAGATGQPVPATMIFENGAGGVVQANDVWIINNVPIIIPLPNPPCYECPPCPDCGGPTGPWGGTIDTNELTATLTVGLPALAGGGTLSANLTGNFQLVETNLAAPPTTALSSNAFPVVLTSLSAAVITSGSQPGRFGAVDTAGLFGPAGSEIYLGAVQLQFYQSGAAALEDKGFIDSKDATFAMNWGGAGAFNVYDATKTNLVGTGALVLDLPETGAFGTNGMAASQNLGPVPATLFLYNSGPEPVVESDVTLTFSSFSWFVLNVQQLIGCFAPGCDGQAIPINVNLNQGAGTDATNYLQAIQSTYLSGLTNLSGLVEGSATFAPQNVSSTNTYGSLQMTSLGNATLTVESNQFVIGGLGSSGLDGVNFSQAGTGAFALHWASLDPSNSLPVGACFEQDLFGTGGSVSNGLLGSVKFIKQSASNYLCAANFSPLGTTNVTVEVLYQGLTVAATNEPSGCMFLVTKEPTDWEPTPRGGGIEYQSTFVNVPNLGFGPHPIYEPADAVNYLLENVPASAVVTSVSLRASGIPQIVITNESEIVAYDGLQNSSVGNATLSLSNNKLTVGNLGANGQNGVQITVGAVAGFGLNWEDPDPSNSLPLGAYLEEEIYGTGGSVTNGLLGTIQVMKNGITNYVCTADFSPMGSTDFTVEPLDENTVELSATEPRGPLFSCSAMPTDFEYAQNTSEFYATYWPVRSVGLNPPREYVLADAVGMIPLTPAGLPEGTQVTAVELMASGIPQIVITNESVAVEYLGISHASLGNATLTVQSNQLVVGNLGDSGQDGVQITLPNADGWAAQWESLDPSNSLPAGAYVQMQDFGSANQVTNGLLGTITVTKTSSSNAVLTADFTPVGVTNFTVQLFSGTNEVAEATNVPTGTVCYLAKIPAVTDGPLPDDTSRFGGNYPISWLEGVQASFSPGGSQTFTANYAVIIPHNLKKAGLSSTVSITCAYVSSISITNEPASGPVLSASVKGSDLEIQWGGGGTLQSSPDLGSWSDMPPNDGNNTSSPYFAPIQPGNQYFRVLGAAVDELELP